MQVVQILHQTCEASVSDTTTCARAFTLGA
jgi:hypothetical protein